MAERKTKAERRQAAAGEQDAEQQDTEQPTKAARKAGAGQQTRAERRQARGGRRQRGRTAEDASPPPAEIESRLARIEEAVANQAERSEELLGKLDEVLHEARKSARHAKSAVAQGDDPADE